MDEQLRIILIIIVSVSIFDIGCASVKVKGPIGENHSRPMPVELLI